MNEKATGQFDIIIVGAGPAGCAAALSLRGKGLRVALIDKEVFPRDKVCGDAIPARAINVLKAIDPQLAKDITGYDKLILTRRTSVVYNGKALKLYWSIPAYTCTRTEFDNRLMQAVKQTDTTVIEGLRIAEVKQEKGGIKLKSTDGAVYKATILIGADGAQSLTAKMLAERKIDRDHHIGAVRAYYSSVKGVFADHTEMYIDKRFLPGYFWVFPVAEGKVNAGFGMISSDIVKHKTDLKRAFADFIASDPALKERFADAVGESDVQGFSLPLGSRKVTTSGAGYLLAGDAASLIDPISGEGVGNAMESGRLAALHALKCFEQQRFDEAFMRQYDAAVWEVLGGELKLHYKGQRILRRMPWLLNIVFSMVGFEPVRRFVQRRF